MKYVKYFLNKTLAEGFKAESDFVAYLDEENKVLYSRGGEVIKNGEMVADGLFIPDGYVDLGLSRLWATCNVGANTSEESGIVESYSETYDAYHDYGAVSYIPTFSMWQELVYNTSHFFESRNGVNGIRFTGSNGNSIFLPACPIIRDGEVVDGTYGYWSSTIASRWSTGEIDMNYFKWYASQTELSPDRNLDSSSLIADSDTSFLPIRLVCTKVQRPLAGAVEIQYNVPILIEPGKLYYVNKTLSSTRFVSTETNITAFFANTSNFLPIHDDINVVDYYPFSTTAEGSELSLSSREMSILAEDATDNFIYIRFQCESSTIITAYPWDASECADKSITITSGKRFRVAAKSSNIVFRLRYDDWKDGDMVIKWDGQVRIPIYIADTCAFTLSSTNSHVVQYKNLTAKTTQLYEADIVAAWASRVDADGFLYVRFNPNNAGYITFTSTEPTTT